MAGIRWFRVYDELVDDPKVQRLPLDLFKFLINMWCLTSQNGGKFPSSEDISFKLRLDLSKVEANISLLISYNLAERCSNRYASWVLPHAWAKRQYRSDTSTERVKRFRNGGRSVSETAPESESEHAFSVPESERKRKLVEKGDSVSRPLPPTALEAERGTTTLKNRKQGIQAWSPGVDDYRFLKENGFISDADQKAIAIKFRDHFISTGEKRTDWSAAFRNWARNEKVKAKTDKIPRVIC